MTDLVAVQAEARQALASYTMDLSELASLVQHPDFTVQTAEDFKLAGELVKDVAGRLKTLEEKRTTITKPLLAAKNAVDELFRPPKEVLAGLDAKLRQLIKTYTLAERERQRQAAEAAAASAATASREQVMAAFQEVQAMQETKVAGVSVRAVWRFEVVDPNAVPREFCSPDPDKIRNGLAVSDPPPVIPGVRVFQDAATSVRTKR